MKLRNKETGEIGKLLKLRDDDDLEVMTDNKCYRYKTLAEVAEHWEDCEEADLFYYIDADGCIKFHLVEDRDFNNVKDGVENLIAIGNWFETEAKAEKAKRKKEAMERLRRKGFRFTGFNLMNGRITFTFDGYHYGGEEDRKIPISDDLDLLFSQEDD